MPTRRVTHAGAAGCCADILGSDEGCGEATRTGVSIKGMVPEDIHALAGTTDPRLSPDGRTIAYVVWGIDRDANAYRSAIHIVPVDGSAPPRQLTAGEKEDAAPRWSPDARSLAFVSSAESEKKQLYLIPA